MKYVVSSWASQLHGLRKRLPRRPEIKIWEAEPKPQSRKNPTKPCLMTTFGTEVPVGKNQRNPQLLPSKVMAMGCSLGLLTSSAAEEKLSIDIQPTGRCTMLFLA
jgi:hypothetical protein